MTLPFLNIPLTTTQLLIGVGAAVGVPVVGGGGYRIYTSTLSTTYGDKLRNQGFEWNIPSPSQLDTDKTTITETDKWKLPQLDCFRKFFPGVDSPGESSEDNNSSGFDGSINISNYGNGTNPIGCMLAKLEQTEKDKFTFKSEIVVKNENYGWAVGTHNRRNGAHPTSSTTSTDTNTVIKNSGYDTTLWTYHFLFLEKEGNEGKVKGGYYLADMLYYNSTNTDTISITLPNKQQGLSDSKKSTSQSWIGTVSSSGQKEIFEDVKFQYGSQSPGLGRSRNGGDLFEVNSFVFNGFYDTNQKKGRTQNGGSSTVTGIDTKMNTHYAPFKGKKGKGQTTGIYCRSLSSREHLSTTDAKRLEEICYKKKDN